MKAVEARVGMALLPHFTSKKRDLVCVQGDVGCDQPIWLAIHSDLAHSTHFALPAEISGQSYEGFIDYQHNAIDQLVFSPLHTQLLRGCRDGQYALSPNPGAKTPIQTGLHAAMGR